MIGILNIIYWVSMLYNGQRILLLTNDKQLATTVFTVCPVQLVIS